MVARHCRIDFPSELKDAASRFSSTKDTPIYKHSHFKQSLPGVRDVSAANLFSVFLCHLRLGYPA